MEPVLIAAVVIAGVAFAAFVAVLRGIALVRRAEVHGRAARLRVEVASVLEGLGMVKRALSRGSCREMGAYIGARTCAIQQGGVSKDMLVELLSDPARRGYVLTAFELGIRDSKAAEAIRHGGKQLVHGTSAVGESAPAMAEILRSLALFVDGSVRLLLSPDFYERFLLDESLFEERVARRLGRLQHGRLHHRELAEIAGEVAYEAVEGSLGRIVGEVERIVEVIVEAVHGRSDGELIRLVDRTNRRYRRSITNGLDHGRGLERALKLLDLFDKDFSSAQRAIVQRSRDSLARLQLEPPATRRQDIDVRDHERRRDETRTQQIEMLESTMANRPTRRSTPATPDGDKDGLVKPAKTLEEQIEEEDREGSVDVLVEDDE